MTNNNNEWACRKCGQTPRLNSDGTVRYHMERKAFSGATDWCDGGGSIPEWVGHPDEQPIDGEEDE